MSNIVTADGEQDHGTLPAEPRPPLPDKWEELSGGGGGAASLTAAAKCRRGCHTTALDRTTAATGPAALRAAWVEFLNRYEWDWFVTMTFPDCVHPERAGKAWGLWCSKLNRELFGPRGYKNEKQIYWVRASEFQRRGVLHYHGLVSSTSDLNEVASRLYWKEVWLKITDGFSRIYEVEKSAACIRYVTKYVVKGGEIDVSKSLASFHRQTSLLPDLPSQR